MRASMQALRRRVAVAVMGALVVAVLGAGWVASLLATSAWFALTPPVPRGRVFSRSRPRPTTGNRRQRARSRHR
jgi:hypothetical protein